MGVYARPGRCPMVTGKNSWRNTTTCPAGNTRWYVRYYGVGCVNGEIVLQAAAALWLAGPEPQETATPWPTPTRLVPPSPTPRALLATPMGASNLDAIIDEGTLTIGWVGPALLGILIAAFG